MAFNFLRPGAPNDQPLVDLPTARSAIVVAVLNAGITSLSSNLLPCHKHMYYDLYQLANIVSAVLGAALLVVYMAFAAAVFRSPAWPPVVRPMVWITKVLTGVTLTYSLSVLHSCLRMYARPPFRLA